MDEVSIGKAVKAGADHFEYFYDTKAKKKVIITLEGEEPGNSVTSPTMMNDLKGPLPIEFENGYVAFEDLPQEKRHLPGEKNPLEMLLGGDDDDDDDDEDLGDEEDEDDEDEDDETEEIYDENE